MPSVSSVMLALKSAVRMFLACPLIASSTVYSLSERTWKKFMLRNEDWLGLISKTVVVHYFLL